MPELPEVEVTKRALEQVLLDQTISRVVINQVKLRFEIPKNLSNLIKSQRLCLFDRYGKIMIWHLSNQKSLLWHLGMSGNWRMSREAQMNDIKVHDHIVLGFQNGIFAIYNDPRRFGFCEIVDTNKCYTHTRIGDYGPDACDPKLSSDVLHKSMMKRTKTIKSALLDQHIIAGIGNIYVSEILWQSGIHPARICNDLNLIEITAILKAIRKTLKDAINAGGSSMRDFKDPNQKLGYFQHQWKCYGQFGKICTRNRCNGMIEKTVDLQRATYYCTKHQI